jgi:hypothetical protein
MGDHVVCFGWKSTKTIETEKKHLVLDTLYLCISIFCKTEYNEKTYERTVDVGWSQ